METVDQKRNREAFISQLPPEIRTSNSKDLGSQNDVKWLGVEFDSSGQKLMRLPEGRMTLKEIFSALAGINPENLSPAVDGSTQNMYAEIAQHEAEHYRNENHDGHDGSAASLTKELDADRAMCNGDHPQEEKLMMAARDLSSFVRPDHATGIGLTDREGASFPDKNPVKMHGAAEKFKDMVTAHLISDGHMQTANDLEKFYYNNPMIVYKSVMDLKRGGAFDSDATSVDRYLSEYVDRYISAAEKYIVPQDKNSEPQDTALGISPKQERLTI